MTTILGLSGSLRRASFNSGLLRAARDLAPEGVSVVTGDISQVPLYNGDDEAARGTPPAVAALNALLARADGLILSTPEYNNAIPGVLKNVIDWMSRGDGMKGFAGKPVAVMGASTGGFGTTLAQTHWWPVLRTLKTRPWWDGRLMVSRAAGLFDAEGNLTDEATRQMVADFVRGFADSLRAGERS